MSDLLYRLAFSQLKGMHPHVASEVLERVGSERAFFELPDSELKRIMGSRLKIFESGYRSEILEAAKEEEDFCTSNHIRCLYFTDSEYPQRLLECEDAPSMLFMLGNANLNARYVVSVVGTRSATVYGVNFINHLIEDLGKKLDDVLVISGLAMGCDITSHRKALDEGIPTVGVVAHGLDTLYPAEHRRYAARMVREGGGIVTDYPHGTRPHRGNFLARNRIVAGLSDAVVVAESGAPKGGALHTARLAQLYNRDVFALPGRTSDTYSTGCNLLIKSDVAHLAESADDIIATMGWTPKPSTGTQEELFPVVTPEQQRVLEVLRRKGEGQINCLTAELDIPVGQLMALLTEMEFSGLVMALPGARYRLA